MEAEMRGDKVIVDSREHHDKGWYGNMEGKKLVLDLIEAMLLVEREKLEIKGMDRDSFMRHCTGAEPGFMPKYTVYRDLGDRGLPVRTGFRGSDFRVYDRGANAGKNAKVKWIVFTDAEDSPCEMERLGRLIKLAKNIRAVALWAVADNDFDVTYYIINSISP